MSLATESTSEHEERSLSESDVYEVLGNSRRRHVLQYLQGSESPVDIGDLAEQVAARENDVAVGEVTSEQRKSVYTSLHQNHLQKLVDAGFVRADRRWADIELTPRARDLVLDLDVRSGGRLRRGEYLLATTAITGGLVAGYLLGAFDAAPLHVAWVLVPFWTLIATLVAVAGVLSNHRRSS